MHTRSSALTYLSQPVSTNHTGPVWEHPPLTHWKSSHSLCSVNLLCYSTVLYLPLLLLLPFLLWFIIFIGFIGFILQTLIIVVAVITRIRTGTASSLTHSLIHHSTTSHTSHPPNMSSRITPRAIRSLTNTTSSPATRRQLAATISKVEVCPQSPLHLPLHPN